MQLAADVQLTFNSYQLLAWISRAITSRSRTTTDYFTCSSRLLLSRSKSIKQPNKEREQKSTPANTVQFTGSTNPQPRIWRLYTFQRSALYEPIWNSQRFDGSLLTREIRRKKHLAARAHTMWMRTVSCAGSVVLYQIIDVSRLYTYLMDTQEHEKSKAHKLGTERKSTSLTSRISDSAVQCRYYHSKFREVRPQVKQRALPLSFRLAKNTKHIDRTITVRNDIGR